MDLISRADSRGSFRGASPSRTPNTVQRRPNKLKAPMRALESGLSPRETFFDAVTPIEDKHAEDRGHSRRDSHDLSFAVTSRSSIVDNMLMSLDRIPSASATYSSRPSIYTEHKDDSYLTRSAPSAPPSLGQRPRGHTYSTSLSSDYSSRATEESSSHFANPYLSRGRRSSSSQFQMGMKRSDNRRTADNELERMSADTERQGITAAPMIQNGRRGSKSSASSIDFGYSHVIGTSRWGFGNRSASFDTIYGDRISRNSPSKVLSDSLLTRGDSVLARGRPVPGTYHDIEAAPEPIVPAGRPRRLQHSPSPRAHPLHSGYAPPQRPSTLRKNTSMLSNSQNATPDVPTPQEIRNQARDFFNANKMRDLPALPSTTVNSATAQQEEPASSAARALSPTRERPGFFRRVFGSSKGSVPVTNGLPSSPPQLPSIDLEYSDASRQNSQSKPQPNQNHIASQIRALPKAPGRAPPAVPQENQAPITKKPSSFFRRRKKSVSQHNRRLALPVPLNASLAAEAKTAEPSPSISSLRKVMSPYLSNQVSPTETYYDSQERQPSSRDRDLGSFGGMSPGSTIGADATGREVSLSASASPRGRGTAVKDAVDPLGPDSPGTNATNMTRMHAQHAPNDSFLADSSDVDDKDGARRSAAASPTFGMADQRHFPLRHPVRTSSKKGLPFRGKDNQSPRRRPNSSEKRVAAPDPRSRATNGTPKPLKSVQSPTTAHADEDGWVIKTPTRASSLRPESHGSDKSHRVWLAPTASEERLVDLVALALPLEGARTVEDATPSPTIEDYVSATSLPIVQLDGDDTTHKNNADAVDESATTGDEPTEEDRRRAEKIFDGEEENVAKSQAAAWLGEKNITSRRTLTAYMELFDWAGSNILMALRGLCSRLMLKGETQQVDRILDAFSQRWCACNPSHGFKANDVVHTICYSILLLNTDLHLADIEQKMTRNQFVKNTLPTIRRVVADAAPDAFDETIRPSAAFLRGPNHLKEPSSGPSSPTFPPEVSEEHASLDINRRNRLSIRPPQRTDSDGLSPDSAVPTTASNGLVKSTYDGSMRGWEFEVEIVLKEFYQSIRSERLPLHGAASTPLSEQAPNNSLTVMTNSMLRRTPSTLSKSPSENLSHRSRGNDFRSVTARWNKKARTRPKVYTTSTVDSSRTSLDDNSVWSPAASSTWSKYSFGKTQTSMSLNSIGSHFHPNDYQQSVGFANALSQAIIREEGAASDTESFGRVAPLLEDESLELAGAPWAKEGILKHKHHLESPDKKAKDRNWNECFAVVEKGQLRLFSFNTKSMPKRQRNKKGASGGVVGGGNWMDNAEALGSYSLRQSIASSLPPPGYSKARPHVWALSLPTGAVHLFQVGTPDIVTEFVSTANYWAARLSKEPLFGGISNIEYGWSDAVINSALVTPAIDSIPAGLVHATSSGSIGVPRPSVQGSVRTSLDQGLGNMRARLPGDNITINDWTAPVQSMMASALMEVDQLRALTIYVKNVEEELQKHNGLRAAVGLAFSPRHPNYTKVMANWEKKSAYLLRESVKFRMYIDSLTAAQARKEEIIAERPSTAKSYEPGVEKLDTATEITGAGM